MSTKIVPGYSIIDLPFVFVLKILEFQGTTTGDPEYSSMDLTFSYDKSKPDFFPKVLFGFFEKDYTRTIFLMFSTIKIDRFRKCSNFIPFKGTKYLKMIQSTIDVNLWLSPKNKGYFENLKGLSLFYMKSRFLNEVFGLEFTKNLRQLEIQLEFDLQGGEVWEEMPNLLFFKSKSILNFNPKTFAKFPNLFDLSLEEETFNDEIFEGNFPKVMRMELSNCSEIKGNNIFKNSTNLKRLILNRMESFENSSVGSLSKLDSIFVRSCDLITGKNWETIGRNLELMKLENVRNFTDFAFRKNYFVNLKTLIIWRCPLITGSEWNDMKNLEKLTLGNQYDEDEPLVSIIDNEMFRRVRWIKFLRISGTPGIDFDQWKIMENLEIFVQDFHLTDGSKKRFLMRYEKTFPKLLLKNMRSAFVMV